MKRVLIFLLFFSIVFLVSGKKIAEFDEILKLDNFEVNGDDLFVVDGYEIKIFSLKDAKFVRKFGEHGEGPGEFPRNPFITVFPDEIFVRLMGKVLFFSREGEFISEMKTNPLTFYSRVKNNFLSEESIENEKMTYEEIAVNVLDSQFNKIRTLYKERKELPPVLSKSAIKTKKDLLVFRNQKIASTDGDFIYVVDTNKGFFIEIYDSMGIKIKTIEKEMDKVPVTENDKKMAMDRFKENKYWDYMRSRFNFIFPEYFPDIQWVDGDSNKLYVTTHKRVNEKKEVLILDHNGEILKKVFVPKVRRYFFYNNKYYYFIENEDDETWELHMIDL